MDALARNADRCSLAAEGLRSWGTLKVRAAGGSMLPTLWPGDVLTVQYARPEQVEPGEIVLYTRQGRFFIHRIVSRDLSGDAMSLLTRGDCMAAADPPVGRGELLGRVVEVRRSGSSFVPARKLSLSGWLLAWAFGHWNLFRRVGLRLRTYGCEGHD